MNCSHVQNLISAFMDCELDAEEKRELRQHLFTCPECSIIYQELINLKNCLQNLAPEPLSFDPVGNLHLRLVNEEHSLIRQVGKFFWFSRAGLVTACLSVFFLSTWVLFPTNNQASQNAAAHSARNSVLNETDYNSTFKATSISNRRRNSEVTVKPVSISWDQNFSIDQSVTIYQASLILP